MAFYEWKKREAHHSHSPQLQHIVEHLTSYMTDLTKVDFINDHDLNEGLTIHLQPVLNRITYSLPISNPLLSEIKSMYPYMFSMVVLTLESLERNFSITLPEDEAAYIVLHFQAAIEREKRSLSEKSERSSFVILALVCPTC
ncbi:PRD domain-containing protein [Bacillus sp. N9]